MPLLQTPGIASAWDRLGAELRAAALPPRAKELAIVTVAAFWRSEMEWLMHAPMAAERGIGGDVLEALRTGRKPDFELPADRVVYDFVEALQRHHEVDDATYDEARSLLGDAQLVALTVLVGHYTNVAMTLRAHRVPIAEGTPLAFG